ncbi:hypothetical protein TRIUR3_06862 [Triticum urartu]|uniref:Glycosyl transferase CAP10 domain-containing protein n=1 Tax=Triticum urartu TaxID=4572 RepID=M8AD97_TRIUA|nr:hypothetical protein TRIUR3_06862 [Triticum urartu]
MDTTILVGEKPRERRQILRPLGRHVGKIHIPTRPQEAPCSRVVRAGRLLCGAEGKKAYQAVRSEMQPPAKAGRLTRSLVVNGGVFIFIAAIVAGAFVSAYWISASARVASIIPAGWGPLPPQQPPAPAPDAAEPATTACPAYFRWIHEDLRPWRATGITRETLEGARRFRVTVREGRLYVARYGRCFQTRDVFTQWGILQLLRRYAGRLPDLDLMFNCQDLPVVNAGDHAPPPLLRYCGSEPTLDIAFPDWSFWGWTPYAYWKGNPTVGAARRELLKCNVSRERDWNARIYAQARHNYAARNIALAHARGRATGTLARWLAPDADIVGTAGATTGRYKMYVEGRGWSVSEKYILACDSVALVVRPRFHDFFSRGLVPLRHYWPVRGQCRSIKFAVDWGNSHPGKARVIGGNASRFVQEELTMDNVYDYMFHLLSEYARLLRYKPTVPGGAVEVTVQSMARGRRGLEREFMAGTAE